MKNIKLLLSISLISGLFIGCGNQPQETAEDKMGKKMLTKADNSALDMSKVKQYVSTKVEDQYYFELLNKIVEDYKSIAINTKTTTVDASSAEFKSKLRAAMEADKAPEIVIKSVLAQQKGMKETEVITLKSLPTSATSSNITDGKNYRITYSVNSDAEAKITAKRIANMFNSFLSHDKGWLIVGEGIVGTTSMSEVESLIKDSLGKDRVTQINKDMVKGKSDAIMRYTKQADEAEAKGDIDKAEYLRGMILKMGGTVKNIDHNLLTSFTYTSRTTLSSTSHNINVQTRLSENGTNPSVNVQITKLEQSLF